MSIRQSVVGLPRIKAAKLTPDQEKILGDAVEEAVERFKSITTRFQKKQTPIPKLHEASVVRDIMLAMEEVGLPAGWWKDEGDENKVSVSLLVEILNKVADEARKDKSPHLKVKLPKKGYWQEHINRAIDMKPVK